MKQLNLVCYLCLISYLLFFFTLGINNNDVGESVLTGANLVVIGSGVSESIGIGSVRTSIYSMDFGLVLFI